LVGIFPNLAAAILTHFLGYITSTSQMVHCNTITLDWCFFVYLTHLVFFSTTRRSRDGVGIREGLPGVLGNKGTKGKYRREQGNMTPVLGNAGT